jgi:hypothetical protein
LSKTKVKDIPILDENVFRGLDHGYNGGHSVKLDKDSYVWVFSGRRGGGKTTAATFMVVRCVALYNMRVISNYPIEFQLRRHRPDGKTYLQHIKNENLDFEKLLLLDNEYRNCLIVIDESPDVISHLASMSWKNRLVNMFIRQIRKNRNTLFLCAQDLELVDKSVRWQVDIHIECRDVARAMGNDCKLENGEMLELTIYDQSGQWTGQSTEDRYNHNRGRFGNPVTPWVAKMEMFPRVLWGDETHKPAFDTYFQIDIMDSLRKVDLKLSKITIGDKHSDSTETSYGDKYPVNMRILENALNIFEYTIKNNPDNQNFFQKWFYSNLGGISDRDKNNLGKLLSQYDISRGGDGSQRWYGLSEFNLEGFRAHINQLKERELESVKINA